MLELLQMVLGLKPEGLKHPLPVVVTTGEEAAATKGHGNQEAHWADTLVSCHTQLHVSPTKLNTPPRTIELYDAPSAFLCKQYSLNDQRKLGGLLGVSRLGVSALRAFCVSLCL